MGSISNLPDELLELVLGHLCISRVHKPVRISYLLTCRKWAAILESQLFHEVRLFYAVGPAGTHINEFRGFLLQKPQLRKHVLKLEVYTEEINSWFCQQVMGQLVEWCANVESFSLDMDPEDDELPPLYQKAIKQQITAMVINSTTNFRSLKELCLYRCSFGTIIRAVQCCSARSLRLYSPSWDVNAFGMAGKDYRQRVNVPRDEQKVGLPVFPLESRSVKAIQIRDALFFSSDVPFFLQWFPGLEELNLSYGPVDDDNFMPSTTWYELLEPHAPSLTRLTFSLAMFEDPRECLKFSRANGRYLLPNLRELEVILFDHIFDPPPIDQNNIPQNIRHIIRDILSGSRIRTLVLCLEGHPFRIGYPEFEHAQENLALWMEQFALLLEDDSQAQHGAEYQSLKKIRLVLNMELRDWDRPDGVGSGLRSTWLNLAKDRLSKLGVRLEYRGSEVKLDRRFCIPL